ncbi:MAG: hypothetical protein LGB57_02055 [Sulfurovum sp.]|nr:hypothetical protein [Sulfurovum sp.]
MMNEKQTLIKLLKTSKGKRVLFLGREGIFTQQEIDRFLKPYGMMAVKILDEDIVGVIEGHRLNPVEEDISNQAYSKGLPFYKLTELEELLSEEIDDDALLMAIKLGNDQERIVRLLGNEHFSDTFFVRLLRLYIFNEEEEDNRQDRDIIMYTLRRYIDIRPSEEDLLYSHLTLRRLATEATNSELLDVLLNFPNFKFLVRGKESVTLRQTIARNIYITEPLVRKLLSYRDVNIFRALAGNPKTSLEVLKSLFSKEDQEIDKALAINLTIDNTLFCALLERTDEEVIALLLTHQPIDMFRLKKIRHMPLPIELMKLIGVNKYLEKEAIEALLQEEEPKVLVALSENSTISSSVLKYIYGLNLEEVFIPMAKNPSTPVWILQDLYESHGNDMEVLVALAHNPMLPQPLIKILFEKDLLEINRGLATNTSLPMKLLDILKVDTRLQNELAQNENLAKSYEEVLTQKKVMMNI